MWQVTFGGLTPLSWGFIAGTLVLGWMAVNVLGLTGNRVMKKEMLRRLMAERGDTSSPRWFVGFARPKFRGLLDPHEDVGWLILESDRIVYWGESRRIELHRDQIVRVHVRPNIHTIVGLGRWVAVEAVLDGRPARLLIEPREFPMLVQNLWLSGRIRREIEAWAARTE